MTQSSTDRNVEPDVGAYYDHFMYDEIIDEFYDVSDFHNFGLWRGGVSSAESACRVLMEELTDFVVEPPERILEVGCGKGATTRQICERWPSAEIVGIDLSERQLATCRENCPSATFVRMDACELEFSDMSFDLIISVEAAFHFRSRREFLEQALLKLRPGGQIVLQDVLHGSQAMEGESIGLDAASVLPAANFLDDAAAYERLLRAASRCAMRVLMWSRSSRGTASMRRLV